MTLASPPSSVLERAALVLARHAGMACPDHRQRELIKALHECSAGRAGDVNAYLAEVEEHPHLIDDLAGALAVGETYFFRDTGQFDLLRTRIIPDLVREHGTRLRVWSAGCASGEEVYSLAAVLAEGGVEASPPVLGTDISRDALRRAEAGTYGEWSFRGVPAQLRARYFDAEGQRSKVREALRARVRFEWLNLAAESYPSLLNGIWGFHLVLCRNVLIYLTPQTITSVAERLFRALAPGGWLLTSPSDPPLNGLAPFQTVVTTQGGVVYRRPDGADTLPLPGSAAPTNEVPSRMSLAEDWPAVAQVHHSAPPQPVSSRGLVLDHVRRKLHALADRGHHAELARLLDQALSAYPLEADLHYLMAVVCLEEGREREAVSAARRALYLDPQLAVGALALGSGLRRLGDRPGAAHAYKAAAATLRRAAPDEPVRLADGERAGGLLRSVESLIALAEAQP